MNPTRFDIVDGKEARLYTLRDKNISVGILDFGAAIHFIKIDGVDITLGFNSVDDYIQSGTYCGASIGRYGNRIAEGKFVLNGKAYQLNVNDGKNHLHGGKVGFDRKIFTVKALSENSITLEYVSPDGEENYPAELRFTVKYTLENHSLKIEFTGTSDGDTLFNPTNHTYFNLDGEDTGDCKNNLLQINANYYTPVDGGLIPTGEKATVKGRAFDFTAIKRIGEDFGKKELIATNGYDHNYILNDEHAAHAESVKTGIKMDIYTNMPCMQLYTGGGMHLCHGKTRDYETHAGFCLEPQFCPNSINMTNFEQPVLRKGTTAKYYIQYTFLP